MGFDTYLWIPEHLLEDFLRRFEEFFNSLDRPRFLSQKNDLENRNWNMIILDRFRTPAKEFSFWSGLSERSSAALIGIDEGGACRNRFDFLIDLLPCINKIKPNISAPRLLPLPKTRISPNASFNTSINNANASMNKGEGKTLRVLISFGAEDSAGLGPSAAQALARQKAASTLEITLIAPLPLSSGFWEAPANVSVIGKIPDLRERLSDYDLLITHFGLGAFEAVYARLPLIIISPTAYHEKLSRHAGFYSLGIDAAHRLENLVFDGEFLAALNLRSAEIARRFGLEEDQCEDLSSFIGSLAPRSPKLCPVCKPGPVCESGNVRQSHADDRTKIIGRFGEESYFFCSRCSAIYLARLKPPPVEYERDYFFSLYKKQYGKTYLEDFPNLIEMGRRRLANIKALSSRDLEKKPALLDIGCAYGPFLAAAAEEGFAPFGVEPAEDAVRYVKEELNFSCWHGFFPDALPNEYRKPPVDGGAFFNVITLWYVIEHFEEPGKILREINRLLKKGGVLAFSTPSSYGISRRRSLSSFLEKSPPDHWTIWSPKVCRKVFRQYGFRLRRIVVTGHHPERFPLLGRFVKPNEKRTLYRFLLLISRIFRLGDTFEAYAVKV